MSEKTKKFESDLDRLIKKGDELYHAMLYECHGEEFERLMAEEFGKDDVQSYIKKLPSFKQEYQAWYTEAFALIKQVLPDRLEGFISYYEYPRVRKEITFQNYMIRDYLHDLRITKGYNETLVADRKAAIPEFAQQINIVKAAKATLESSLISLTSILQADLFDSEIDSARALAKSGYLRAAGAICGVVIEKHLKQICHTHGIVIRKKNPTIFDFNQALKNKDSISVPQYPYVAFYTASR